MGARLLLVDDDEELRRALAGRLALHDGFETAEAGSGAEALRALAETPIDLILLDAALPDLNGRDLCRVIRRRGVHLPIIMLTGQTADAEVILGLDAGANDYIFKPFSMPVLLARIRAHLRQHATNDDAAFALGPYSFRPAARRLVDSETRREIPLSEKECAILRFLFRADNRAIDRDTLYAEVWNHRTPLATHTLQTHVYRLRRKIERDPANPRILVSEPAGYRLVR
jgi:DNA-binding response OmpR family regulator